MKQELKRFNRIIVVCATLLGLDMGAGITLFVLNLTSDLKGMTLAGLICLILSGILALLLLIYIRFREVALARLEQEEAIFGKGVEVLSQSEFVTALRKERNPRKIYAIHLRLATSAQEEDRRFARLSLADLLYDNWSDKALIGYTGEADFLLHLDNDSTFVEDLAEVDRHLRRNPRLVPYGIYVGRSEIVEDIERSIDEAVEMSYRDTSIRESLSILDYEKEEEVVKLKIDIKAEIAAKRLRFRAEKFEGEGKTLYLLEPELYDSARGAHTGKDFHNALVLANQEMEFDIIAVNFALEVLEKGWVPGPLGIELSGASLQDASFWLHVNEELLNKHIKTKKIVFFLHALSLHAPESRIAVAKISGMRLPIGVYEYGEERMIDIVKAAPSYVFFKSEYVRPSADRKVLGALIDATLSFGALPLLRPSDLLAERSAMKQVELIRLEQEELEPEEGKEDVK